MTGSQWLSHQDEDSPVRIFNRAATTELESIHERMTLSLGMTLPEGTDEDVAAAGAANIIASAAIDLQRKVSPQGHLGMARAIFYLEPLTSPLRDEIRQASTDKARKAVRKAAIIAFSLGALLGLAAGIFSVFVWNHPGSI